MRIRFFTIALAAAFALTGFPPNLRAQPLEATLRGLAPSQIAPSARITDGDVAAPGDWPWQLFIITPKGGDNVSFCGGALIAPQWALTAAHCFIERDAKKKLMIFEQLKRFDASSGKGEAAARHDTDQLYVHPGFRFDILENDIALVHLAEPAKAELVAPLLEPSAELEAPPARAFVTGFGATRKFKMQDGKFFDLVSNAEISEEDLANSMSHQLLQAELPLVALDECKSKHHLGISLDEHNLCAGYPEGGKGACKGDSGGPLVAKQSDGRWREIGVVSWGEGCGMPDLPGVFTRVSAFASWIKSVAGRDLGFAPQPTETPGYDNAAGVAVAFDRGDHVRVGERVAYRVSTRQAGYLAIFDAAPDGKLTQIFPNARSALGGGGAQSTQLAPDHPALIPNYQNPYRGFDVRISERLGKGVIVAVLSDEPLRSLERPNAPKTYATTDEALSSIERLRAELKQNFAAHRASEPGDARPNWSIDIHEYFVE